MGINAEATIPLNSSIAELREPLCNTMVDSLSDKLECSYEQQLVMIDIIQYHCSYTMSVIMLIMMWIAGFFFSCMSNMIFYLQGKFVPI